MSEENQVFLVGGPCRDRSYIVRGETLRLPVSSGRNAVYRRPTDPLRARYEMEFVGSEAVAGYGYGGVGEALLDLVDQMERDPYP